MPLSKENLKRKNFSADEFFKSEKAVENNIINYPTQGQEQAILVCLMSTADMMQEIRDLLNCPIDIGSAYRNSEVNKLVKGSENSQHMQGLACDFTSEKFGTPEEIMKFLYSKKILVDQCFCEGTWLHISRKLVKDQNRMMYGYYLLNKKTGKREFKKLVA